MGEPRVSGTMADLGVPYGTVVWAHPRPPHGPPWEGFCPYDFRGFSVVRARPFRLVWRRHV